MAQKRENWRIDGAGEESKDLVVERGEVAKKARGSTA